MYWKRLLLDGYAGFPMSLTTPMHLEEVTGYITDPGIGVYNAIMVVISESSWDKLPADVQETIMEVSAQVPSVYAQNVMDDDAKAVSILQEAGVEIYTLAPTEFDRWKAAMAPIIDGWVEEQEAEGLPAKEFFKRFINLVNQYEAAATYITPFERFVK